MEFKKIDEEKFQCLLYEEDLEDNNISLDDFFKNDTEKIHGLLDVVMKEAKRTIGVNLEGEVMSLQLAPRPDHSIMLTISSGREDFTNMLKQAGERAESALASLRPKNNKSNVIKNPGDDLKSVPFETFGKGKDLFQKADNTPIKKEETNFVKAGYAVFKLSSFEDFEELCFQCPKTWGVFNCLYKNKADGSFLLVLEKGRCAEEKYRGLLNILMEYGIFDSAKEERIAWIYEHCEKIIAANAINITKKYL